MDQHDCQLDCACRSRSARPRRVPGHGQTPRSRSRRKYLDDRRDDVLEVMLPWELQPKPERTGRELPQRPTGTTFHWAAMGGTSTAPDAGEQFCSGLNAPLQPWWRGSRCAEPLTLGECAKVSWRRTTRSALAWKKRARREGCFAELAAVQVDQARWFVLGRPAPSTMWIRKATRRAAADAHTIVVGVRDEAGGEEMGFTSNAHQLAKRLCECNWAEGAGAVILAGLREQLASDVQRRLRPPGPTLCRYEREDSTGPSLRVQGEAF